MISIFAFVHFLSFSIILALMTDTSPNHLQRTNMLTKHHTVNPSFLAESCWAETKMSGATEILNSSTLSLLLLLLAEAAASLFTSLINSHRSNPGAALTVISALIDKAVDQRQQPIQARESTLLNGEG